MNHRIQEDHVIYAFARENVPVLTVPSGSTVVFETRDCFSNQLRTPEDTLACLDWNHINPATGPVSVEGVRPGDALRIAINRIQVGERGILATGQDLGLLGARLAGLVSKHVQIVDGQVRFSDRVSLPCKPMIGVIGVAPAGDAVPCGTPGAHGGNMDNARIAEGAVLYLPVAVPGALFGLGDLHAAMGDGEVGVSGVEVAGQVEVRLDGVPGLGVSTPVLEDADWIYTIHSSETLDLALQGAVDAMADLLQLRLGMEMAELAMLMSACGQSQVCQVVDPLKTARFAMPKPVLAQLGMAPLATV